MQRNLKLHILPYFKDKSICDLSKKDIIDWENIILSNNYKNSFNKNLYSCFSTLIQYCVEVGYLDNNIVLQVKNFKSKPEPKEYKVYNIHQFRRFRKHLDNYIDKQYFNCIFFLGTRPSEALGLRFCDIDANSIHIEHSLQRRGNRELDTPKNQSSIRHIKISLLMFLRFYRLKKYYKKIYGTFNKNYFIFGGKKPLSTTTLDRRKKDACDKANLYVISQHGFRHSYATRMINKEPIDAVSRSMGHSNVSTTLDIYSHNEKRANRIPFLNKFI